ncbi:MAG: hypothetical protein HYY87_03775 [Candidatus Levybacteria bacterium]|nr:hypothetical protein [Candidatus Levybacteria bacterium]
MNFGFDLDKIFIDYPPFIPARLIDRLYKQKSDGVLWYRIPSKPERFLRLITHYPLFRPPIFENIRFMQQISRDKKHKHYLISSRFSFLRATTETLLKKYGLYSLFKDAFFNYKDKQPHLFKAAIIEKLNIHRYVDDDLPLLQFIAARNPKTKFFWLNSEKNEAFGKNLFSITHLSQMFL